MARSPKNRPGMQDARSITETDLAQDEMGKNSLQGDDQSRVRNERRAVPEVRGEPDASIIETLEKSDKDVRAERDLGKGRRHSPEHPYNKAKEGR